MKILIVDDEEAARYGMSRTLNSDGRTILEAGDGKSALIQIKDHAPDVVFLDLNMPEHDGMFVLKELQKKSSTTIPEIIIVTANEGVNFAVDCIRAGATDFITKPYDVAHLRSIVKRSEERVALQRKVATLAQRNGETAGFGQLIGTSRPMQQLYSQIRKTANTSLPVMIRGESGTGKELVARELHARSDRADQPFIAVNTAAIANTLIESELFGHGKGAFTGAADDRLGVFRQANMGTLFLDEIGDMPAAVQTRLLRVLQEGVLQPVGTDTSIGVDVRIISATHQDLEQAVQDKVFREDLYFRLKGIELSIPALRSRPEDILLLVRQFLPESLTLTNDAVTAVLQHKWPGNVRELQQVIAAAAALCDGPDVSPHDIGLVTERQKASMTSFEKYFDLPLTEGRNLLVADYERQVIRRALDTESGNVSAAARRLGIHRQSLQQKMKALDVT